MAPVVIESRPGSAVDEEKLQDAHSVNSQSPDTCGIPTRTDSNGMEIRLPPPICDDRTDAADKRFQIWRIPHGIIRAQDRFEALLPELLKTASEKWVYVTANGEYGLYSSQDAAEVAAEDARIRRDEFVVRFVSVLEQVESCD